MDQVTLLRGEIVDIGAGFLFLIGGLTAVSIAAVRHRHRLLVFLWLGVWSAMYGAIQLTQSRPVLLAFPPWLRSAAPYANTAMTYLTVVAATLAFVELTRGPLRRFLQVAAVVGMAIAVAGIAIFVFSGDRNRLMNLNNLLADSELVVLTIALVWPRLGARGFALHNRTVLVVGALVFAIEALSVNIARPLGFDPPRTLDHLGFAVLIFSLGAVALQLVFDNDRRLVAIENELRIARGIQAAILPERAPATTHVRVEAAYRPMDAVAGDYYDFVPVDDCRAGVLVADVCGHGVPAALIASMIRVALKTTTGVADDPGAVLRNMNRVLLDGHLVSAAYLWLDTGRGIARYSAAGHPPLLRWTQGRLERISSNGPLFGMTADSDYPVVELPVEAGDRFLLYTDGITECESAAGEFFGDARLEHVVRAAGALPSRDFVASLLGDVERWRPSSVAQQDDITIVVVDALQVGSAGPS